ncbi:ATP-binding cassette, sub-family E, member 1 [Nematocida minor]|uniref:ATP-binding cassette, sub-family E, member 1 n=1 Tax=Nematocida minor TaxID=1912983 RepID=UPI002220A3AF|nr:ATP-binding cassette, sub-family E, member 1 [Nematocida minor]KAI5190424.1 ATP-binding cassette, sub-family E, member 1 [Nematocida minor]
MPKLVCTVYLPEKEEKQHPHLPQVYPVLNKSTRTRDKRRDSETPNIYAIVFLFFMKEKNQLTRLAVVLPDKCKPKLCQLECKKACPVNRQGKPCITVEKVSPGATISEILCIGCGACQKKCPFDAIRIINLPTSLNKDVVHRYSPNGFKLHRLPLPKPNKVLGLIGTNGIGKSTALGILSGNTVPNLNDFNSTPDWAKLLVRYRGSELHKYFTRLLNENMKISYKTQYVDKIPRSLKDETVKDVLPPATEKVKNLYKELELEKLEDRRVKDLSGGELQRFAIAQTMAAKAEVYIFDEPSSYLDVRQRIKAATLIRKLCDDRKYVIVVEHDLSILDLMSDYGCVLYGVPGAYGVISQPFTVREAINIFLNGMLPTENMRFRAESLTFRISETAVNVESAAAGSLGVVKYPSLTKAWKDGFKLTAKEGAFSSPEIIVLLGENGMGKTTFIKMLAQEIKSDNGNEPPKLTISIKPQKLSPKYEDTVRNLFLMKAKHALVDSLFTVEVMNPLDIKSLFEKKVKELSGGELQRVAIALCLSKPADLYLIDEPSAYLDSDQRIVVSKVLKRFITSQKRSAFLVEHDMIMATYVADRMMVFEGTPGVECTVNAPGGVVDGMNMFLKSLDVTFRRDAENYRPRINMPNSAKDREQKESGNYFFNNE